MNESDNHSSHFHRTLGNYIKDSGLLQRYIAKQIGVSSTFLSRWKGDRLPLFAQLLQLCTVLKLKKQEKRNLIRLYYHARIHPEGIKAREYLRGKGYL